MTDTQNNTQNNNFVWIASFDIGKKNFSFCIEEVYLPDIQSITNIPLDRRYNLNGTPTDEMKCILDEVCGNGKVILHENKDLTAGCDSKLSLDPLSFHNMNDVLDSYVKYFDKCKIILIEQQMSFRGKHNLMALKLGQHCYSYFVLTYGKEKEIIEFPAYHKTQILGCEKLEKITKKGKIRYISIDKPKRKKWSIAKATEILELRGEDAILKNLKTVKKKDDLADVITQLNAFKFLRYVAKKI